MEKNAGSAMDWSDETRCWSEPSGESRPLQKISKTSCKLVKHQTILFRGQNGLFDSLSDYCRMYTNKNPPIRRRLCYYQLSDVTLATNQKQRLAYAYFLNYDKDKYTCQNMKLQNTDKENSSRVTI